MWKYKLTCPFGGVGVVLAIVSVCVSGGIVGYLEMRAVTEGTKTDPERMMWLLFGLPAAVMVLCFLWVHRPSRRDKEGIADAQPPEWMPFAPGVPFSQSGMILVCMREKTRSDLVLTLALCGVLLSIPIVVLACGYDGRLYELVICVAVIVVLAFLMLRALIRWAFWHWAPLGMDYCTLEPAYSYHVPEMPPQRFSRRFYDTVAVWYLPDGKYRVYVHDDAAGTLFFIRWHGIVRWIYW